MLKGYIQPYACAIGLGYDLSDAKLMAELSVGIEFCEAGVDQYCGTQFEWEENASKIYDGSGTNMLTLGFFLRKLKEAWVTNAVGDHMGSLLYTKPQPTPLRSGEAYRWLQRYQPMWPAGEIMAVDDQPTYNTYVIGHNMFPAGLSNIEIIGDWGWKPDEMPIGVQQAMLYAVKHFFDLRVYNDLVQMDSGLGRTIAFKVPRVAAADLPVHYLPEVSRRILTKWVNRRWMTE